MPPERGQTVRVPSKPEWGLGQVIESDDGTVSVLFSRNVLKKFRSDLARFEVVEDTGGQEDDLASPTPLAPMRLTVSPQKAEQLIEEIPHATCRAAMPRRWQVAEDGTAAVRSAFWLYCWGKTGMGSPTAAQAARQVFDSIFPVPFREFDALVPHAHARRYRY